MTILRGHRKRQLVTIAVAALALGLFAWQWASAPRVKPEPAVAAELELMPGNPLYLGKAFEGLALRRVGPFYYSDCRPAAPRTAKCHWVRVVGGRVSGSDAAQVARARKALRPLKSG